MPHYANPTGWNFRETQDRYHETARMVLKPWIVEATLARFAVNRLTSEEQEVVIRLPEHPLNSGGGRTMIC
jgi:hypothetical protein